MWWLDKQDLRQKSSAKAISPAAQPLPAGKVARLSLDDPPIGILRQPTTADRSRARVSATIRPEMSVDAANRAIAGGSAKQSGSTKPNQAVKIRRDKLQDLLTPQQHAANRILSEVGGGCESELQRLGHDIRTLEASLRESSTQSQQLTVQLDAASAQRDLLHSQLSEHQSLRETESERYRAYVVGYEKHLAEQETQIQSLNSQVQSIRDRAQKHTADLIEGHAQELRTLRGAHEAAEIAAAARADQFRRWQRDAECRSKAAEHQIAELKHQAVTDRAAWNAQRSDLEQQNRTLADQLAETKTNAEDASRQMDRIRSQSNADLAESRIKTNVLKARLESSETTIAALKIEIERSKQNAEAGRAHAADDSLRQSHTIRCLQTLLDNVDREAHRFHAASVLGDRLAKQQTGALEESLRALSVWKNTAYRTQSISQNQSQELQRVHGRLNELAMNHDGLVQVLERQDFDLHEAGLAVTELRRECHSLSKEIVRHETESNRLAQAVSDAEINAKRAETDLDNVADEVRAKDDELIRVRATLAQCRSELAQASKQHQTSENELNDKRIEVQGLADAKDAAIQLAESTQADLAAASAHLVSVKQELIQTRQELAESWKLSQEATDRLQRSEATLAKLQDQERRLIEVQESQYETFQTRINQLQTTIDDVTTSWEQERELRLAAQQETTEATAIAAQRSIESQQARDSEFQTRIDALQTTIDELTGSLEHERGQRASAENETRRVTKTQEQREAVLLMECSELAEHLRVLREQHEDQQRKLESLTEIAAEAETSKTETARLKARLSAGTARGKLLIQQYKTRIEAAERRLAVCEAALLANRQTPMLRNAA
ncbi:Chromosome partition protein Smc [Rubripirellula lacrimiformis]|uniref:Chromosome partition protein Smc n=1 Tax=Rubripirellula lacrimiformis TaxID=1930273 RepID=A0A517NC45_9BACT|nr:hypothetical protein [Rubripirellula lacrimiformis]QDT04714.1 Chromosome partition protein Smc [Rubripirellula lacrimiformis]